MTTLTSLGRALALDRGRAQRLTTVRHVHIGRRPLVLVPLAMAGEAHAPMAALIGTDREDPKLLIVAQPRNRDQRFAFAHKLAHVLLGEILSLVDDRRPVAGKPVDTGRRCTDAPQIWVPNRAGVEFVRLLGRSTRFRKTAGPYPVPANVPQMGKWLTFYADRSQYADSHLLVAATAALSEHWATGQSPEEDEHLGTVLAWIQPGAGVSGAEAAVAAEDPVEHPPAGPATDPTFDNEVLAPLIKRHQGAGGSPTERARMQTQIEKALRAQMIGAWDQVWQTIDLLQQLQPGRHIAQRWTADLDRFTRAADWIATSQGAQRRRDTAVAAARRLYDLECAQDLYDAQRAFDDPMVMAEAQMMGEAFAGTVVAAEPERRVGKAKRPLITMETIDPLRLPERTEKLSDPARPRQKAMIVSIVEHGGGRRHVVLELSNGMGTRRLPEPGSVPAVGEQVVYSLLSTDFRRAPALPDPAQTPWTHGGPPQEYVPTDADAREPWE